MCWEIKSWGTWSGSNKAIKAESIQWHPLFQRHHANPALAGSQSYFEVWRKCRYSSCLAVGAPIRDGYIWPCSGCWARCGSFHPLFPQTCNSNPTVLFWVGQIDLAEIAHEHIPHVKLSVSRHPCPGTVGKDTLALDYQDTGPDKWATEVGVRKSPCSEAVYLWLPMSRDNGGGGVTAFIPHLCGIIVITC